MAPRRRSGGPADPPSLHLTPVTAERREPPLSVTEGGDDRGLERFGVLGARLIAALHRRASRRGDPLRYTEAEVIEGWAGPPGEAREWLHRRASERGDRS
jgi:hypothetical protein